MKVCQRSKVYVSFFIYWILLCIILHILDSFFYMKYFLDVICCSLTSVSFSVLLED
jgi:hypothetical protein